MMFCEIIMTADGSHTLYVPDLKEHYHSTFGAIQESEHVYIKEGLLIAKSIFSEINILEVGFGTGLNALLTLMKLPEIEYPVHYHAIEAFPLSEDITAKLNYPDILKNLNVKEVFTQLHKTPWNNTTQFCDQFSITKSNLKLEDILLETDHFHLVYFDAFAPDIQPEMWKQEVFNKIVKSMKRKGILVTYSAKGSVRRCMQSAGLKVERIPGPPGKREMLRGRKIA